MTQRSRRPGTVRRGVTIGIIVLLVASLCVWFAWCSDEVVKPTVDPLQDVDAVYVLGPLETRDLDALAVMDKGVAPVMIATESIDQQTGQPYFTQYCGTRRGSYTIECVIPTPYDTKGEAEMIGRLASERGYKKVAVFTSTPHVSRARLLVKRCTSADVVMWDYQRDRSLTEWLNEFVHQSGGWFKAQLDQAC